LNTTGLEDVIGISFCEWEALSILTILQATQLGFRSQQRGFFLFCLVWTGSVVHPVSYQAGVSFPWGGVKQPGCEVDHSHVVSNAWIYTSMPPYIFMYIFVLVDISSVYFSILFSLSIGESAVCKKPDSGLFRRKVKRIV